MPVTGMWHVAVAPTTRRPSTRVAYRTPCNYVITPNCIHYLVSLSLPLSLFPICIGSFIGHIYLDVTLFRLSHCRTNCIKLLYTAIFCFCPADALALLNILPGCRCYWYCDNIFSNISIGKHFNCLHSKKNYTPPKSHTLISLFHIWCTRFDRLFCIPSNGFDVLVPRHVTDGRRKVWSHKVHTFVSRSSQI